MLSVEIIANIRRLFHAEHWKVGTIAAELNLHRKTVERALKTERFNCHRKRRGCLTDPYIEFIRETLTSHPRLRATRLYEMLRLRGYTGSVVQLRRVVARHRPIVTEAFLRLRSFPGEQAQVDWAHFGKVTIGRAERKLYCFVMTFSYSRALYLEFFLDQTLESFLRGHVRAFHDFGGVTRTILYDNLRSAVLERRGELIHFHPRLLELCAHYHFKPMACRPARGNEKGRVERVIRFIRESYFYARSFTNLQELNRQALNWRDEIAHRRRWPEDKSRFVEDVFEEEKPRLLELPAHCFDSDLIKPVMSRKTIYIRFDLNDYSIPPEAVGRQLSLVASDTTVRILDGLKILVTHQRCYDREETIEKPAHKQALLEQKRKALGATRNGRLHQAAPQVERFLDQAFQKGESPARVTAELLRLLDDYGPDELSYAIKHCLERETPRSSSVAFILKRRHVAAQRRPPMPVQLKNRPDLASLHVQPHQLEIYDGLFKKNTDE
ncbi:MAG: IS21 family transposase [Gammaproteobacteria bacterium]|nr:IS21 family transposase [Gammaproteobacteria bacterium]